MPPCEFSILDCELRIATGDAPIIAEVTERSSSEKRDCLPNGDIRVVRRFGKAEAGWRSYESPSGTHALLRTGEAAFVCRERGAYFSFVSVPQQVPPNTLLTRP
jgi:hypothetical protein